MGAEEGFPFQNKLRRLAAPHGSAEFPAHAILQSVSVALAAPFCIEFPQSILMRNTRSTRLVEFGTLRSQEALLQHSSYENGFLSQTRNEERRNGIRCIPPQQR